MSGPESTASRWCSTHDEPAAECWSEECLTASRADVDELGRLLAAATPGPWTVKVDHLDTVTGEGGDLWLTSYMGHVADVETGDDAALIAALVNAAPALLAEVAELREAVARVREFCDENKGQWNAGLEKAGIFDFNGGVGAAAQDVLAALDGAS